MTTHADELISQQRDEPLGPAEDLFVRHHVAECQECRAFAREVEAADRLLRHSEPYIVVPPQRSAEAGAADRRVSLVTLMVATALVIAAIVAGQTAREAQVAAPQPGVSAPVPLGTSMAGVALGDRPAQVLATLGEPERRADQGRQWVYVTRRVIVFFDAPVATGGSVWRIMAFPGSLATTAEGFGGCCTTLGTPSLFRHVYRAHTVTELVNADPATPLGRDFIRFLILAVTGQDAQGREVTVWGTFAGMGEAESVQVFRGRPEGDRLPATGGHVLDPLAVSTCEVLVRAVAIAGYDPGLGVVGPWRERGGSLEFLHCDYGNGARAADAHLVFVPQPVAAADVPEILRTLPRSQGRLPLQDRQWQETGPGQWQSEGPPDPKPEEWGRLVAVVMEPYLFMVSAADAERTQDLADAVREALRIVR